MAAVAPITYQSTEKFGSISLDKMDVNNSEAFARATEVEGPICVQLIKFESWLRFLVTNQDNQDS